MTNSRAAKGANTVLLDTHLATTTETTYTFTPALALDMVGVYREIIVIITGKSTAALGIALKLNANTDYDETEIHTDTVTIATALTVATVNSHLIPSNIIDGASSFVAQASIVFNNASDHLMFFSRGGAPHEGAEYLVTEDQSSDSTITSIELLVTTSSWIAGTEITIYGLKR